LSLCLLFSYHKSLLKPEGTECWIWQSDAQAKPFTL